MTAQLIADVLVNTGMRWSELAGLHWSRVDLVRGVVTVVETYDDVLGKMKPYPKGKRARVVPLPQFIVKDLGEIERGSKTCGVEHMGGRCSSGLVFTSPEGRPLRNSNWSPMWRTAVDLSHVGHVRIHDLRHTYASWLAQEGIPLTEIGRMLGHVSTQTTQKYAHLAAPPNKAVLAALKGPGAPRKPHRVPTKEAI